MQKLSNNTKQSAANISRQNKGRKVIPLKQTATPERLNMRTHQRLLASSELKIEKRLQNVDQIKSAIEKQEGELTVELAMEVAAILLNYEIPENYSTAQKKILAADLIEVYDHMRHFHPGFMDHLHLEIKGSRNAKILQFARKRFDVLIKDVSSES